MNSPFDSFLFSGFPIFFVIMFVFVFGMIIFTVVKGISTWSHNNSQPVLTVDARIVAKRENVSSHMSHDDNYTHHNTSTTYYVTFQVESGDRIEFIVNGNEYGLLAEGDAGKVTFQGSRFLGFKRDI